MPVKRKAMRCRRCRLSDARHWRSPEGLRCANGEVSPGFIPYLVKQGATGSFSPDDIAHLNDLLRAILAGDLDALKRVKTDPRMQRLAARVLKMKVAAERNRQLREADNQTGD